MRTPKIGPDTRTVGQSQHAARLAHDILEDRKTAPARTGLTDFREITDIVAYQRHDKIMQIAQHHAARFSRRAWIAVAIEYFDDQIL